MLQTLALNSVLNDTATLKIALNFLVEGSKHLASGQTGAWETRECYLCNISIGKPDVAWKKCQTPGESSLLTALGKRSQLLSEQH